MSHTEVREYSRGSKILHWVIGIIVLMMLSMSFFLDDVPDQYQSSAYMIHKSIGLTILMLMVIRLFWIVHFGKPALPRTVSLWERVLSRVVQYSLYVLLFAMPLCGWIMSVAGNRVPVFFGLFQVPLYGIPVNKALSKLMSQSHETIAWMLIGLITLHVTGALKHYLINKDNVMSRMLSLSKGKQ